jgi:hypothetical protein
MAKKRKTLTVKDADTVGDLVTLAQELGVPDHTFEDDVEDECKDEALEKARVINEGGFLGQLEYLLESGYSMSRLEEIIREAAKA